MSVHRAFEAVPIMHTTAAGIRMANQDGQRRDAIVEQRLTDDSWRFQAKMSACPDSWAL